MKFRVDRDVFADAVAWAARSLPVRPSAPVLAGLLIQAGDEGLVLSTFDYETSCRATVAAEVSDEGSALVSGRLLADICRSLPAKPVDLMIDGARVSLTCGSARFSLQTMPVEDYPSIPDMPAATGTVPSDAFAHAVAQAVTAAGRDDMLPVLTGVRIEIEGDTIALLATDRFRLAQREVAWNPGQPDASLAALVPARVLGDTAKSLTAGPEVTIALSASGSGDGLIGFEGSGPGGLRRTTTRLLDGEFPKVRSLFPSERLTVAKIDKADADRVPQAGLARRRAQHRRPAGVQGRRAHPRRRLRRRGPGVGVGRGQIEGEDLVTGFNPQFLLDGLGVIDEAVVELAFTQASKPVVITGTADESVSDDAGSFRYLLMPRRLLG